MFTGRNTGTVLMMAPVLTPAQLTAPVLPPAKLTPQQQQQEQNAIQIYRPHIASRTLPPFYPQHNPSAAQLAEQAAAQQAAAVSGGNLNPIMARTRYDVNGNIRVVGFSNVLSYRPTLESGVTLSGPSPHLPPTDEC